MLVTDKIKSTYDAWKCVYGGDDISPEDLEWLNGLKEMFDEFDRTHES